MASSVVEICNLALGKVGDTFIASVDANSREARLCQMYYASTRDGVLMAQDWAFAAARRGPLAALADAPAFEFSYAYNLPSDCLRLRGLYGSTERWVVEGRQMLTNDAAPNILYTRRVEDVAEFPAVFVNALAARLAATIAYAMAPDGGLSNMLYGLYKDALLEAKRVNSQEQDWSSVVTDESSWVAARS